MSDDLIQRALSTLRRESFGTESVPAGEPPAPDAAEAVYARADAQVNKPPAGGGVALARASLAQAYLAEGRAALAEVSRSGTAASLTRAGEIGLEAIVRLTGRPSYLVQDDLPANVRDDSQWKGLIDVAIGNNAFEPVMPGIGRVNLPQRGKPGYQGTAFMVAPGVAMTNKHVALTFARAQPGVWSVAPGYTPAVDFKCEHGSAATALFAVTDVLLVHPDPDIDLALLRLAPQSDDRESSLPPPLDLVGTAAEVAAGRDVYAVGYPAFDPRNDAGAMEDIFGDIFYVKRFAPGSIMAMDAVRRRLMHDCSTLGGNSGSCIVDFSTHRVCGLHFGGAFQVENRAVQLSMLRADPALTPFGLNFV